MHYNHSEMLAAQVILSPHRMAEIGQGDLIICQCIRSSYFLRGSYSQNLSNNI